MRRYCPAAEPLLIIFIIALLWRIEIVKLRFVVIVHRPLYREAFSCRKHENPEAASAIWGRMLHICASRSVLLDAERTVTVRLAVSKSIAFTVCKSSHIMLY